MTRHANPTLPGKILDAAERIVAAEGPGALSMRRLAGATGVTPPTLYYYFTSKDRLLTLVRLRTAKRLNGRLQRLDLTDTRSALVDLAGAYIGFAEENPRLFQLLVELPPDAALLTREEYRTLHFPYFAAERVLGALALRVPQDAGAADKSRMRETADASAPTGTQDKADAPDEVMTRWLMLHGFVSLLVSGALENVLGLRREELKAKFLEIYAGRSDDGTGHRPQRGPGRSETA